MNIFKIFFGMAHHWPRLCRGVQGYIIRVRNRSALFSRIQSRTESLSTGSSGCLVQQTGGNVWCAPIRRLHVSPSRGGEASHQISPENGCQTGLFDNPDFSTAEQFSTATAKCIETSKKLVEDIIAKSDNPDVSILNQMDLLSDELCRVADLAECIRQVHPDYEIAAAAEHTCLAVNTFVEELNTNVGLYMALKNFMQSDGFSTLDEVGQRTAEVFMHDFEVSGIHLKNSMRQKVVSLNQKLLEVGYKYVLYSSEPTYVRSDLCSPSFDEFYDKEDDHFKIDHVPYHSLDRNLRKNAYLFYYGPDMNRTALFEDLILKRQQLAELVGYPSFAHRVLKMSMAENPETVTLFLERLSEKVLPLAREDAKQLKVQAGGSELGPWDVPLLTATTQKTLLPVGPSSMRNWFSLDACIGGLRHLFKSLFDVRLEASSVQRGEVWDPSVNKFCFIDKDGQLLGVTYGDLMARKDKLAFDCHFTIRGGRDLGTSSSTDQSPTGSTYQLPVITICCSIEQYHGKNMPKLLSQHSVETLFHEMGHALHSILGRARYQNITGTRCSTDFAEVPSILMEFFLCDDRILSSFASHHESGEPLPQSLLKAFQLSRHFFSAYDTQIQIYNAFLDQKFHSSKIAEFSTKQPSWSAQIYKDTAEEYSPLGYTPGVNYYLRFPHLCSYGGRYYSYLWSRAVASLIWKSSFQTDPFSSSSGEKYRVMLSHGGGVRPSSIVKDMLGFEPTVDDLVDALYQDVLTQRKMVQNL